MKSISARVIDVPRVQCIHFSKLNFYHAVIAVEERKVMEEIVFLFDSSVPFSNIEIYVSMQFNNFKEYSIFLCLTNL